MQRRNFIKTTACLTCFNIFSSGCSKLFNDELSALMTPDDIKNSKFYYKSKNDLPKKIRLEGCSLCQLNCPDCGTRLIENKMPKNWLGYLKFKDFKNFVNDNEFLKEIELSNRGEIFLNPELDEIIKYAHEKTHLTADTGVNLNTISEKTIENIVKYKFARLTIALDGASPETYKIYRRGGDFDRVIDNIKKINYFKEKYNSEFPKLTWQFIPFGHNEHEIESAKEKAKKLNMDIKFKVNWSPQYFPVKNKELVEAQTGIKIIQKQEDFAKDAYETIIFPCKMLFYRPQIDYNGDLTGCCRFVSFKENVFEKGLLNALNSPKIIYAKTMLTDFYKKPQKDVPCTTCSQYKIIKKVKRPMEV